MSQKSRGTRMRPVRYALVALGFALLAVGGQMPAARGAAAVDCNHADVIFFTNDTGGRLVGELKKFPSCTDFYVTVTPRTAAGVNGFPNPTPVGPIHAAGANFHAMAEIRLKAWAEYVATGHTWYDAGLRVRELMRDAGYDAALGDTWALNEVGEPSTTAKGVDVIKNAGDARQNVRDFIRGLYTGDGTPLPGLVFAADPIQVATDLSAYEQDLENWYADSAFWGDIGRYVRFWAQEGYADVRAWGVAGSTLAERASQLNDYFLHGARLAAGGGDATKAARDFFANAYTPIGNAAYKSPPPSQIGFGGLVGFGSTSVDLTAMLNFVSTQAYAMRLSRGDRFGFADQRIPAGLPLDQIKAVEDRVAEAIQASVDDASGACGASGEWCDSSVDGAAFTGLWRELAGPRAPTIVPKLEGQLGADGWYTGDVKVTWTVTDPVARISSTAGCGDRVIDYDTAGETITCTATSYEGTGAVDVTVKRDATAPTVTCEATPGTLWPPNHRLVPVSVALTIDDETSGPGPFALTETSSSDSGAGSDIRGFDLNEPDVEGLLRAERRPAAADGRSYVLTYVAHDAAGNAARCAATVVVPHDQGD